jgi:hypothetical protein
MSLRQGIATRGDETAEDREEGKHHHHHHFDEDPCALLDA